MAFKTTGLRYLGGISGEGAVMLNGETVSPAKIRSGRLFSSLDWRHGQRRTPVAGRCAEEFVRQQGSSIADGRGLLLALRFSDLKLPATRDFVRVEVTAQPTTTPEDWRQ